MRAALYFGEMDEVAKLAMEAERIDGPHGVLMAQIGRYVLGDVDSEAFLTLSTYALNLIETPRMRAVVDQVLVEAHAARDDVTGALRSLEHAVRGAFVDVEWLRHCPVLEPLRTQGGFGTTVAEVEARARALWVR